MYTHEKTMSGVESSSNICLSKKYPNSVPVLLNPCDKLNGTIKKRKFIVPKEYAFSRFVATIRSKCDLNENQGLFFFVDGTLPVMTETMGQIYERRERDGVDDILVIDIRCENTFGASNGVHGVHDDNPLTSFDVVVDNRETDLLNLLSTKFPSELGKVKVEQLPVGDVIIRSDGEGEGESAQDVKYVFERKTMRDLRASIRDGRWKEQKRRLMEWFPKEVIVYIIEDFEGYDQVDTDRWSNVDESAQISGILNTIFRDGLKVICTRSLTDTARFITEFSRRCPNYMKLRQGDGQSSLPTFEGLKSGASRKSGITTNNIFQLQLCQIPGVSSKISEAFKQRYPKGFQQLFDEYNCINESDQDKKTLAFVQILKDIPISVDNNNRVTRRLGLRTAQNIAHHLLY